MLARDAGLAVIGLLAVVAVVGVVAAFDYKFSCRIGQQFMSLLVFVAVQNSVVASNNREHLAVEFR